MLNYKENYDRLGRKYKHSGTTYNNIRTDRRESGLNNPTVSIIALYQFE